MYVQVLNNFLNNHATSDGPFLLDDYSFAECSAAPFIHNTKLILLEFKKEDLLQLARDKDCKRLSQWMEVKPTIAPCCIRPLYVLLIRKVSSGVVS